MAESADLLFRIAADAKDAESTMARFRAALGGDLDAMKASFTAFAGVAVAGAAVVAGALVAAAEKAASYAGRIDDMADKTGLSAEAASRLSFAAKQLGVDHDRLTNSLGFLQAATDKARGGGDEQLATFQRLGITQRDLIADGSDVEKTLLRVADAFRGSTDATAKARIARELFSRGGVEMIDFLNRGSEGIAEFKRLAEELGVVLSEKDVLAAKAFRLELDLQKASWEALGLTIGKKTIPLLTEAWIFWQAAAKSLAKPFPGVGFLEEYNALWEQLERRIRAAESAAGGAGKTLLPPAAKGGKRATPDIGEVGFPLDFTDSALTGQIPPEIPGFRQFLDQLRNLRVRAAGEFLLLEDAARKSAAKAAEDFVRPLTTVVAPGLRDSLAQMQEWEARAVRAPSAAADAWQKSTQMVARGLGQMNQAMGASVAYAIVYRRSVGEAFQAAAAAALASIAAEAFIQAIYSTALGFLRLAQHDYPAASEAFTAAGVFASVGGAAALVGRAIAPRQAGAGGVTPVSLIGDERGGAGSSSTGDRPRSGVTIIVQGNILGRHGIDELTEIINDAVQNRDVRLIATQVRRMQPATV